MIPDRAAGEGTTEARGSALGCFGRLWRGEVPLADAFWNWAVIGGLAVNIVTTVLFLVLVMRGWPIAAVILGHGVPLPYNLLAGVGVWRSAGRYEGPPLLAKLARAVAVVGLALLSVV